MGKSSIRSTCRNGGKAWASAVLLFAGMTFTQFFNYTVANLSLSFIISKISHLSCVTTPLNFTFAN